MTQQDDGLQPSKRERPDSNRRPPAWQAGVL